MFKRLGQHSEKSKQKTRQLWDWKFDIVKEGLDEKQVIAFVDNLIAQHKTSLQASAASLSSLIKKAVMEAEQIAASIKMRAQAEAEDEATAIISQAKQEAEEIKRRVELEAQKETEEILSASNRKAEITEVEAKQQALLFLLRAREEIEKEVRGEYKSVHSRLSSALQALMSEGQNVVADLKDKRERLWESKKFELKEYEATLLGVSGVDIAPTETLAPTETEMEPAIASKEEVEEEPSPLQEEAPGEGIEQPVQLQEVAKMKAEGTRKAKQAQKQAKKEAKLAAKEEAQRKAEEAKRAEQAQKQAKKEAKLAAKEEAQRRAGEAKRAKQAQEEAEKEARLAAKEEVEGRAEEAKIEATVQFKEEAAVFEPVEEAREEPLGQPLPEEIPGKEEKVSTEEAESAHIKLDSQALYSGEVELYIPVPVELKMVSKLYNYLQTIPELKILHTRGSWDRGTTITVVLDKPMPLISVVSKIPEVEVKPELLHKDNVVKGKSGLILRGDKRGVKGIKLILKEAPPG